MGEAALGARIPTLKHPHPPCIEQATGQMGLDSRLGERIFFSASTIRAVGPTQPPSHSVPDTSPTGENDGYLKLITHLYVVPRLRMRGVNLR